MKLSPEENKLAKRIVDSIPATHETLDKEVANNLVDFVKKAILKYKQFNRAPIAATFEFNEETNQDDYFSSLFTQDVLADVGGSSYIYEQVGEMIDDAIRLRKKLPIYAN